jgi:prevent-host-death family protein
MPLSERIKPISYFKAHASEIIRELSENQSEMIITQNGEAKAVVVDIRKYEALQESLAMLKLVSLSRRSIELGKTRPAGEVLRDLKEKIRKDFSA